MSGKIAGQVWDLDLPVSESRVLMAMADHADHDGNNIYPGIGRLAWKTSLSVSTVLRTIKKLEKKGIVIRSNRTVGNGVNVYSVNLAKAPLKPPYIGRKKKATAVPERDEMTGKFQSAGRQRASGGVTVLPPGGVTVKPLTNTRGVTVTPQGVSNSTVGGVIHGETYNEEPSWNRHVEKRKSKLSANTRASTTATGSCPPEKKQEKIFQGGQSTGSKNGNGLAHATGKPKQERESVSVTYPKTSTVRRVRR